MQKILRYASTLDDDGELLTTYETLAQTFNKYQISKESNKVRQRLSQIFKVVEQYLEPAVEETVDQDPIVEDRMERKPTGEKPTVLLIEDEEDFRRQMRRSFGKFYRIVEARSKKTALDSVQRLVFDLVLLDLSLDDGIELDGLELIKPIKQYKPSTPIIIVTKDQRSQTVVEALRRGADDFLNKAEFDSVGWRKVFDSYLTKEDKADEKRTGTNLVKNGEKDPFIGESEQIKEIKKRLRRLSEFPDTLVLITGETGVGKEVAARYLHQFGQRKNKPFKAVNLTAVSETLMESELFGHKKGAFTHAISDQEGAFQQADGGVLLLDEIGEINSNIQVKLLRFLQDKIVRPVGGKDIQLDIQIVTATNRDLENAVADGKFRQDLFYRLNDYQIVIPPLRERPEDIELLMDHYLKIMDEDPSIISPEVRSKLLQYQWPGNVRQLINVLKKLVVDKVMKSRKIIKLDLLPEEILNEELEIPEDAQVTVELRSPEIEAAWAELSAIENALRTHIRKSDAANSLGWNLDKLKYTIVKKHLEHYPELLIQFPTICKKYRRFIPVKLEKKLRKSFNEKSNLTRENTGQNPSSYAGLSGRSTDDRKVSSPEKEAALAELNRIEASLKRHVRKGDAAKELGWDLDKLKYTIVKKHLEHYPELLIQFPTICQKYRRFIPARLIESLPGRFKEKTDYPEEILTQLERIEQALIDSSGRKSDAALALGLKNDQALRYKVKRHYSRFPELFRFFPTIQKTYKLEH